MVLCLVSILFHYLCRIDIGVENDIARYINGHMVGDHGSTFAETLLNVNILPVSIQSTIIRPETRWLRATSGLQRITTDILLNNEGADHDISEGK